MLRILFSLFSALLFSSLFSQNYLGAVYFTDKDCNLTLLSEPESFLSSDAISRRKQLDIEIDETDLPVCAQYLSSLTDSGCAIVHSSKWLNCAVIALEKNAFETLRSLPFVDSIAILKLYSPDSLNNNAINEEYTSETSILGASKMIHQFHHAEWMYTSGLSGKGVKVAVIDGGFLNTDSLEIFRHLFQEERILLEQDVTEFVSPIYRTDRHGTAVLSLMASQLPNVFIGSAPEADYMLIRSEVANYENPVEEYHWLRAAELADSAGAQLINSSLGYFHFDDSAQNHTYAEIAKNKTVISKAVKLASEKGILVVTSAGNEGNRKWIKTTFPGDVAEALTVGAATADSSVAGFSSRGTNGAEFYKPDLYAWGKSVSLIRANGAIGPGSGTSYASPIIAGYAACLMQAFPRTNPQDIKRALILSSHLALQPDSVNGHGIPDLRKAYALLAHSRKAEKLTMRVFPNPATNYFTFELNSIQSDSLVLELNNSEGKLLRTWKLGENKAIFNEYRLELSFPSGVYWVTAHFNGRSESFKLIITKA